MVRYMDIGWHGASIGHIGLYSRLAVREIVLYST